MTATAAVLPAFPSYEVLVAEFGVDLLAERDARLAEESDVDPRAAVVLYDPAVAADPVEVFSDEVAVSPCEVTRAEIAAALAGDEVADALRLDEALATSSPE